MSIYRNSAISYALDSSNVYDQLYSIKCNMFPLKTIIGKTRNSSHMLSNYLKTISPSRKQLCININANDYFRTTTYAITPVKNIQKFAISSSPFKRNRGCNLRAFNIRNDHIINQRMVNYLNAKIRYSKSLLRNNTVKSIHKNEGKSILEYYAPIKHHIVLTLPKTLSTSKP